MQTSKTRHQFYLPDEISAKLDAMAAQPGSSKTAILTDALTAWFDRRAGHELDQRFGARLDRQSRIADRTERSAPLSQFDRPPLRPTTRHPEGRPASPAPEYARKAAPQGLDPYGRSSPARNFVDENIIDIPAFLRRKAS